MRPRYNIKITNPDGSISYLTEAGRIMQWTFYKADQVISAAKKLAQFAGATFTKEMV